MGRVGEQRPVGAHQFLNPVGSIVKSARKPRHFILAAHVGARRQIAGAKRDNVSLEFFKPTRQPPHDGPCAKRNRNGCKDKRHHETKTAKRRARRWPARSDQRAAVRERHRKGSKWSAATCRRRQRVRAFAAGESYRASCIIQQGEVVAGQIGPTLERGVDIARIGVGCRQNRLGRFAKQNMIWRAVHVPEDAPRQPRQQNRQRNARQHGEVDAQI
jgi:hypothetical protein